MLGLYWGCFRVILLGLFTTAGRRFSPVGISMSCLKGYGDLRSSLIVGTTRVTTEFNYSLVVINLLTESS